uniref:uncharacterized protein LOC122583906 n=1 Tax=Erigeron canadensis TaxID=72917 RepID=UPI001CB9BF3C|nr:uncharacterized protein LOC122583906 [Erigeron canadensis]
MSNEYNHTPGFPYPERSFPVHGGAPNGFQMLGEIETSRIRDYLSKRHGHEDQEAKQKRPNKKSWKQRTDMYMRPFQRNVFFSKRFIHAKVMHTGTSKVVSVATTNSKELRNTLPSWIDNEACRVIGRFKAERSKEADVFAVAFEAKKNERIEDRLAIVLDTIKDTYCLKSL